MEIQKLKEMALIFKATVNSKNMTTLDIFYNVENCAELLSTDTYLMYTPTYKTKTEPALSFRGSIEKSEVNKLKVGLRNVSISSKDIIEHAKWTCSVYNRNTDQYQLISKSRMNISSITKVTRFTLQLSDLQHLSHENALLFKWNIEILPSLPGHAKEKSPEFINEALDELFINLSVDNCNESEKLKTLFSIMKDMGECKDQQIKNEDKLETIEHNVFDINQRLTRMLSNINVLLEHCMQERELQAHNSAQAIPTDKIEVGDTMKMIGDTSQNSTDHYVSQDTRELNVCPENQTDLPDLSSLGDENQDTDPHHFTSDQSRVQSDDIKGPLIGDHETQESEGGEADIHKYFVDCKKNPGHSQFIPVDTFTLKHLPEGFQDKDLYEYIKVTADLTVRVDVRMTSPDRPKFWPKTTKPYSFYNMSERRNLRTGSGRVWDVNKFQDGVTQDGGYGRTDYTKCWCRKCKDSDSPSNVWWEFYVTTATHVVFDDIEANHTTLRLFYDRDDSPVVSVDKVSVDYVNIEYDLCRLKCVTCDKTLGNKLMEMFKHLKNVWEKDFDKYKVSRSEHRFMFIVSHPHGCSKQVSVGRWMDRREVGDRSKFAYTTCTCPGSGGAHVQCLGYSDYTWSGLVHSGTKSGLNYSGLGLVE